VTHLEGTGAEAAVNPRPTEGVARSALLLAKPGIVFASALAGYAGMTLAARGVPQAATAVAGLTALVSAAVGAAMINGVLDAAPDRRMARLESRTAALARLGPRRVLAAACCLLCLSLSLSLLRLNPLAASLTLAAILSYTVVYTLYLKRRSPFGAVPGGIPGALPVLIGYASVSGRIGPDALVLFAVMLLWQPPHFWALALEYREDYAAAGVPVLPVAMGEAYTKALIFLYATALVPASLGLWLLGAASASFAVVAVVAGAAYLAACYAFVFRSPRYVFAFRASILYLAVLLLALVADVSIG
jgi:protoheme IX farnesyltransferase